MFESKKSYRDTRVDFERHINILMESMMMGNRIVPKGYLKPNEGILRLRYTPNKRINLNTIDERARTMAMGPIIGDYLKDNNFK
jgi:hypothetical protein